MSGPADGVPVMAILAYGINHRTAPIELRERIAFPEENLSAALSDLKQDVPTIQEAAILSTCNRTELYCATTGSEPAELSDWLTTYRPVDNDELLNSAYHYWDHDAARHVIRVASGLDSQVLGEPQVLGQLKAAYEIARQAGTLGPELNLLSQISLNVAKQVRTDTDIGRNPISVAYAAVSLAQQIFESLSEKKALLLGAGDTIQLAAEHLAQHQPKGMAIANRTLANAQSLASRFNAEAMQLSDVPTRLEEFDILIASTGSPFHVLGKGAVEAAIRKRRHRPIFMVDIAVPRDIEPEVGDLPDVYLYTIDDLTQIIDENLANRQNAAADAELLVVEGADRYARERRAREGADVVRQFREHARTIQALELDVARERLANGGDVEKILDDLARNLTNKLIHTPTVGIRETSAEGRTDLLDYVRQLYGLK